MRETFYILFCDTGNCDARLLDSGLFDYNWTVSGESSGWESESVSFAVQPEGDTKWAWSSNDESAPWIQVSISSKMFTISGIIPHLSREELYGFFFIHGERMG